MEKKKQKQMSFKWKRTSQLERPFPALPREDVLEEKSWLPEA